MPKYKLKEAEAILFQGKHLTAGNIVIATREEIKELQDKGIDCFIELNYKDIPVKEIIIKEDRPPWNKMNSKDRLNYQATLHKKSKSK